MAALLEGSCDEARRWARGFKTPREAWEACARPAWMLLWLKLRGWKDAATCDAFTQWCLSETPLPDGRRLSQLPIVADIRRHVEGAAKGKDRTVGTPLARAYTAAVVVASELETFDLEECMKARAARDRKAGLVEKTALRAQARKLRELVPVEIVLRLCAVAAVT
jgi:hypothetical protein